MKINKASNQKHAVIDLISKFDISNLAELLKFNLPSEEFQRGIFLRDLNYVFERFKEEGDSHLIPYKGNCNNCNKCDTGASFVGNKSNNYINLVINSENGIVTDIHECTEFKNEDVSILMKEVFRFKDPF